MRRIPSGPLLKNASPSERSTGSNKRIKKDEIGIPESRGDIDAQKEGFGIDLDVVGGNTHLSKPRVFQICVSNKKYETSVN
jgi:hypothetical protein